MGMVMTPLERSQIIRFVTSPEFERGYDRGRRARTWLHENKTEVVLGAIALAATAIWIYRQRASSSHFSVSGVWTDLAKKQGIEIGSDLTIKEAQRYLNGINDKTPPNHGGTGLAEDGILGNKTSNAIRAFQAGNGLPQTGVIDDETGNALSYFAAATSKSGAMKKYAAVSPATIASLQKPVTYTPYAMPVSSVRKPLLSAVDIGEGWVMYGNCACKWDDAGCAAHCGGAQPTSAPPSLLESALRSTGDVAASGYRADIRTGIQSTSMYSPQNYYTDAYGAWVLPMSPEEWWYWWS